MDEMVASNIRAHSWRFTKKTKIQCKSNYLIKQYLEKYENEIILRKITTIIFISTTMQAGRKKKVKEPSLEERIIVKPSEELPTNFENVQTITNVEMHLTMVNALV